MYYVYVLRSERDQMLYYGFTSDLEKRLYDHNRGIVKSTKGRRPLKIVYYKKVETRHQARKMEKYFKSGSGREYIKNMIKKMAPSSNG